MNPRFKKMDIKTEITFGLVGDSLRVEDVSKAMGVGATRSFEKGDTFTGHERVNGRVVEVDSRRPRGVWQLSTSDTVASDHIADHALALLQQLEPKLEALSQIRQSAGLFSRVSICHVGSGGFALPSDLMKRISALCDEVSVICWEVEEVERLAAAKSRRNLS